MGKRVFSDEQVKALDGPQKRTFSDQQVLEAEFDPNKQFKDQYGRTMDRTLSDAERSAGAALGALEAPLMGYNDEVVGTADAVLDQGARFATDSGIDLLKQFGVDPNLVKGFIGYDENFKPNTMAEGRAEAARIKDNYAKARETGEIGFFDADNVASNVGNVVGSIGPYEGLYRGAKAIAVSPIGTGVLGLGHKLPGAATTLFGLGAAGVGATAMTEAGNAQGTVDERVEKVYQAGGGPLAVGAMLNILGFGAGAAAAPALRAGAGAFTNAQKAAWRRLAELANNAGVTPEQIAATYYKNQARTKEMLPADTFPFLQKEAGDVARFPGASETIAADALVPRQLGATSRVSNKTKDAYGVEDSFKLTFEQLDDLARTKSKALFDESDAVAPLMSPGIKTILESPTGREMVKDTLRAANVPTEMNQHIPFEKLVPVVDDAGNVVGYPMQLIQNVKETLDDKIGQAFKDGDNKLGRSLKDMQRWLLKEVDTINPKYAAARAAYAGPKTNKRALELGASLYKESPDYVKAQMSKLKSQSERDFFEQGYARTALKEIRGTADSGNPAGRAVGTLDRREAAEAVLGPEKYAKYKKLMDDEATMHRTTYEAYGNSNTQPKLARYEDSKAQSAEALADVIHGIHNPVSLIKELGMSAIVKVLRRFDHGKREHIAKWLFSKDPETFRKGLMAIRDQIPWAIKAKKAAETGSVASGGLITSQGAPIANQIINETSP